jgi:Mlc titration factor MtfA (ptsG expression regulator)
MRWTTRRVEPSPDWQQAFVSTVDRWHHLDDAEIERLRAQAWELTRRCRWEGLDGVEVTPDMQGLIATEGCLLSVNVGSSIFRDVTSILVAPTVQNRLTRHRISSSVVSEAPACVLGESLLHGPVRLAWDQIVADRSRSSSVIIHEFSHKFDMADGYVDGEPPLGSRERARRFSEVVTSAMHFLAHASDPEPLSEYALTNRAEFFACATEAFFARARLLRERFGDLYTVLSDLYHQNPASSG